MAKGRDSSGKFAPGNQLGKKFGHGEDDQDPTQGGRRASFLNTLKDSGWSKSDIRKSLETLLFCTMPQLTAYADENNEDEEIPVILKVTARQIYNALVRWDYTLIRELVDQVVGKAHITKDVTVNDTVSDRRIINIIYTDEGEDTEEAEAEEVGEEE